MGSLRHGSSLSSALCGRSSSRPSAPLISLIRGSGGCDPRGCDAQFKHSHLFVHGAHACMSKLASTCCLLVSPSSPRGPFLLLNSPWSVSDR
eukprot:162684-Chlamydomonas_euryale.AAC.2